MCKTKPFVILLALLSLCLLAFSVSAQKRRGKISGELKRWHRVTLTFDGPQTSEDATSNPFRERVYLLTVPLRSSNNRVIEFSDYVTV